MLKEQAQEAHSLGSDSGCDIWWLYPSRSQQESESRLTLKGFTEGNAQKGLLAEVGHPARATTVQYPPETWREFQWRIQCNSLPGPSEGWRHHKAAGTTGCGCGRTRPDPQPRRKEGDTQHHRRPLCASLSFAGSQGTGCRGLRPQFLVRKGCSAWACVDAAARTAIWGMKHSCAHSLRTAAPPHWQDPYEAVPPWPFQKSTCARAPAHISPSSDQRM